MAAGMGIAGAPASRRLNRIKGYWPLWLVALVVAAAAALFVVSRMNGGGSDATIRDGAPSNASSPAAGPAGVRLSMLDLMGALRRTGVYGIAKLDVFIATPEYFAVSGRTPPASALEKPSLLFFVAEDAHDALPAEPPRPLLRVDGATTIEPGSVAVLADSEHHRTLSLQYPALGPGDRQLVTGDTGLLELIFPPSGDQGTAENVLAWELPVRYTDTYTSGAAVLQGPWPGSPTAAGPARSGSSAPALVPEPALTWAAVLAIMAGMLTALSPCLIQLAVYFTATLSGVSTEDQAGRDPAAARRHIILTGAFFALGFTLVYTAGGAAAGYVGQSLDQLGLLERWMRPVSVVAGGIIILMAIRVAWNARAPLVCKLPMTPVFGERRRTSLLDSTLMGLSFAGGCLACFSASVLPALLLYAGSTGSVAYGALLLGVFSLGISLPCLALAFGVSRAQPLLRRMEGAGPALGLASAAVMAGFGFIMLTDQFHIVSGLIGRYFAL